MTFDISATICITCILLYVLGFVVCSLIPVFCAGFIAFLWLMTLVWLDD